MHVSLLPCFLSQERPKHEKFVLFGSFRCILLQIIAFFYFVVCCFTSETNQFSNSAGRVQIEKCKKWKHRKPQNGTSRNKWSLFANKFCTRCSSVNSSFCKLWYTFFSCKLWYIFACKLWYYFFSFKRWYNFLCKGGGIRVILNFMGNLAGNCFWPWEPDFFGQKQGGRIWQALGGGKNGH